MTLLRRLCLCLVALSIHVRFLVESEDNDPEEYSLRLRDGDTEYEGRLEIYYQHQWGTICGLGWTNHEGNVACKQLGFYGVFSIQDARHFGEGTGPILLKDVMCASSDNIQRLTDCNKSDWYVNDCDQKKVVGLRCLVQEPPDPLHEVRLVGGNSIMEGRIEIYYNGDWGTVCGDGWDFQDAIVVCRQLKFGPPKTEKHNFGPGDGGPILISFASCFGWETRLLDCPVDSSNRRPDCIHEADVGVICNTPSDPFPLSLRGGISPFQGRVSLYYHGRHGTICADALDIQTARVVCRQLGYGIARHSKVATETFYSLSDPVHLSGVRCNGDELYLAACSHAKFGDNSCTHKIDAAVVCAEPSVTEYELRLTDGTSNYDGRLEMFVLGRWETICYHPSWDITAADVACRQMNVGPAISAGTETTVVSATSISMSSLSCVGNEKRLIECDHDDVEVKECGMMGVVTVKCQPFQFSGVADENNLRLVAGSLPYEGRIELYADHTWGTLCSNDWDINDAMVACRQMGFGVALQNTTVFNKGRHVPPLVDNMACLGDEDRLTDCKHGPWGKCDKYTYYGDAGVICNSFGHGRYYEKSTKSWEYFYPLRLVGGTTQHEGRLEILVGDTWGTVAETNLDYWNLTSAHVACHHLGYEGAVEVRFTNSAPRGEFSNSAPIHVTGVECVGTEGTISVCSHSRWRETNMMDHRQDVYVICSIPIPITVPLTPASRVTNNKPPDLVNDNQEPPSSNKSSGSRASLSVGVIILIVMCILVVIGMIIGVVLYNYRKRIKRRFPHLYPGNGAVRL